MTWPNHTTLVTGVLPERHGLLYNGLPVRAAAGSTDAPVRIDAHVDKPQLVMAPTVYDAAHAAGLTTAEIDWVAIENAPITFRDEIWTRAAEHLIKVRKPNLMLYHLLTTDSMQHQAGARSLGAQTALALADTRVARLVEATRQAGLLASTTFVIVSDHGFKTFKRRIRANVFLKSRGLGDRAWAIAEGGTAMVYVTGAGDKAATIETLKAAFTDADGIGSVLTPAEFAAAGFPSPTVLPRIAELVVAGREGVAFIDGVDGAAIEDVPAGANIGSHGYLNSDPDMQAIFIASGAGVRKGVRLGVIQNLDVAPTLAVWLGVSLPTATGKPLDAAIVR